MHDKVDKGYNQKATKESMWSKEIHPREDAKEILKTPLTSS